MIPQEATKLHRELYGKLDTPLQSYDTTLSRMELLAVTASIVGKLMLIQDIRLTDEQVSDLVWKNI